MNSLKWLLVLSCLVAMAAVLGQGRAVSHLRLQNQGLRRENQAHQLAAQDRRAETAPGESERLRLENEDLLKLRNEVRQLRELVPEIEGARAEHQRLLQAKQNPPAEPSAYATPEGYVGKDALADLGLGTPEAAVQTFLWTMREGNFKRMLECASPRFKRHQGFDRLTAEELPQIGEQMGQKLQSQMQTFKDFRIIDRKEVTPEEVTLQLRSSLTSAVLSLSLRRVGNDWLVDQFL